MSPTEKRSSASRGGQSLIFRSCLCLVISNCASHLTDHSLVGGIGVRDTRGDRSDRWHLLDLRGASRENDSRACFASYQRHRFAVSRLLSLSSRKAADRHRLHRLWHGFLRLYLGVPTVPASVRTIRMILAMWNLTKRSQPASGGPRRVPALDDAHIQPAATRVDSFAPAPSPLPSPLYRPSCGLPVHGILASQRLAVASGR